MDAAVGLAASSAEPAVAEAAEAALAAAGPRLRRMARVVQARYGQDLEQQELEQEGAIGFLGAWPRGRTNPAAYALRAAEGAMLDRVRQERQRVFDGGPALEPSQVLPRRIRRAVRSLRRPLRTVLLAWLARTPDSELAAQLGCSVGAIQVRRCRALKALRAKIRPAPAAPPPIARSRGGRPPAHDWAAIDRALDLGEAERTVAASYQVGLMVLRNHRYRRRAAARRVERLAAAGGSARRHSPHSPHRGTHRQPVAPPAPLPVA